MLAALLLFAATPQLSWEERQPTYLLPEDSEYDSLWDIQDHSRDYRQKLRVVFRDLYENRVFARMLVEPSFDVEYAVAIERDRDFQNYKIVTLTPAAKVWFYVLLDETRARLEKSQSADEVRRLKKKIVDLERDAPGVLEELSVKRCELSISPALGETLFSLWAQMLFDVRYHKFSEPSPGGPPWLNIHLDGVNYHFGFEYGQSLAGYAWSPSEQSNLGRFVSIGDRLRDLCESPDIASEVEIARMARELLDKIKGAP